MTSKGDELCRSLLSGETGEAAYELLQECFSGYPVAKLRKLLRSSVDSAIEAGIWIAVELGDDAKPLLADFEKLLAHRSVYVRYHAIAALRACIGGPGKGNTIAKAVSMIVDSDSLIRWRAIQFLTLATTTQLRSCLPHLRDETIRANLQWMLCAGTDSKEIVSRLNSSSPLERGFAAAAAGIHSRVDMAPLGYAAKSRVSEIRRYATHQIQEIRYRQRRQLRLGSLEREKDESDTRETKSGEST